MLLAALALAAAPAVNYDEAKVTPYVLPDPLVCRDGRRVEDAAAWRERRRPELLDLFAEHVYGRTPETGEARRRASREVLEGPTPALGGKALRTQWRVWPVGRDGPHFDLLVHAPAGKPGRHPAFLGLNFGGNHTTTTGEGVRPPSSWVTREWATGPEGRADPGKRGAQAGRWQLERVVGRGYAVATLYYGDLEGDAPGRWREGIRGHLSGGKTPGPGEWGAIGAWAWGLSRALDALESHPAVDPRRVAVIGHSRNGKAALWAGAQDERFALVISNQSGCGGAALSRRDYGETLGIITGKFPHWFEPGLGAYQGRESELPVDQHELLALAAPRPVHVGSAVEDRWADPRGEFLAAVAAGPVYRLLGKADLGTADLPPPGRAIGGSVGYHLREGRHDINAEDWGHYLDFADRHLR